jgi:hypothetical protein
MHCLLTSKSHSNNLDCRPTMPCDAPTFLANLVATRFATQYYVFCDAFQSDLPFTRRRSRNEDVVDCLQQLGRHLPRHKVDRAYVASAAIGIYQLDYGFAFQSTGLMECMFGWREGEDYIGGNYCTIAQQVQAIAGLTPVDPPYPRPAFCGPERLLELLSGWDALDRILRTAAELEPPERSS